MRYTLEEKADQHLAMDVLKALDPERAWSIPEIAAATGISAEGIRHIEKAAIKKLRRHLHWQESRDRALAQMATTLQS